MALVDLSHTAHTTALTGIQRVCRELYHALKRQAPETTGITFDPHESSWRALSAWERDNLAAIHAQGNRKASWPFSAKLEGTVRKLTGRTRTLAKTDVPVFVPEIFSPAVARALPSLFATSSGRKIAIFHDAIAVKYPEYTPAKTVARFPAYLLELASFDGVAAVSEDSRQALASYWTWIGLEKTPPLVAIPLGITRVPPPPLPSPSGAKVLACIGTLEARKNHLTLLKACERLWSKGVAFELQVVGMLQKQTGGPVAAEIARLAATGRPITYKGAVGDPELERVYAQAHATVYPSYIEGFGLPILESVVRGRPCLCANRGAILEVAAGGGCLPADTTDCEALTAALERFVTDAELQTRLAAETRIRSFRTWDDYAADLLAFAKR